MKGAIKERIEIKTPERLMKDMLQQVADASVNQEDKKGLGDLSSRVVLTKMDKDVVEGVYYAGSTDTLEEKDSMGAAEDIANIKKLVHRTGRTLNMKHSEAPPPAPNDEGAQSLKWKSELVGELTK